MAKSKYDKITESLVMKFKTNYKKHKGIDIVTNNRIIEVETSKSGIYQGINQVKKSSKARYIAVNDRNIQNALNATKGTGIEVMDEKGKIVKRAGRKNR